MEALTFQGHLNIPFFLEGACSLLDAEGEWCFEKNPSGAGGRVKVRLDVTYVKAARPRSGSAYVRDISAHATRRDVT